MMRRVCVMACLVLLTGCASLSESECLTGDWVGIGQRDGAAGQVADAQFARHVDACRKAGVSPARADWQVGYARGLQTYCTPSSGLKVGLKGGRYRNVCPAGSEPGFLRGLEVGLADHAARAEVARLQNDIARLQARNSEIITRLAVADDPSLRLELSNNRSEILQLRLEAGFARADAARTRRAVAEFSPA